MTSHVTGYTTSLSVVDFDVESMFLALVGAMKIPFTVMSFLLHITLGSFFHKHAKMQLNLKGVVVIQKEEVVYLVLVSAFSKSLCANAIIVRIVYYIWTIRYTQNLIIAIFIRTLACRAWTKNGLVKYQ